MSRPVTLPRSSNLTRNLGTADARVVFVRYGITAPEAGHDDYAGVDVRGKLVAYMFGAPSHSPAMQRAHYSDPGVKAENAIAHGAVGILVFLTPEDAKLYPWEWLVPQMQAPRMAWIRPDGSPHDGADLDAVAALSESGARKLFARAARPLDAVFTDAAAPPFELAARVRARIVTRYEEVGSANVVGLVPGSDPALRDEYVVYSAHLDHLGLCPPADGDPVCHGAFDNASGVAVLLELARAYARMKPAPRRSVVFLFVTGEEQAAFAGSDYFAEKPTVPREGIVANINVDGAIGIFGDTKDIVARGAEHSTLDVNVRAVAGRIGYTISPDPAPEEVLFIRSDQYSFVRRGIPALYVTEGSQAADPGVDQLARAREWLATRYHTPLDNMAQPTDYEAIVKGARFLLLLGYDVAQRDAQPEWNKGDFFGELYGKQR